MSREIELLAAAPMVVASPREDAARLRRGRCVDVPGRRDARSGEACTAAPLRGAIAAASGGAAAGSAP